jgi:large subunit ribosomal protein L25
MITQEVVQATPREGKFNKNAARRVRAKGRIPAVVYGAAQPPQAIELDPKQMTRILHSESGHNSIFDLEVAGASDRTKAMIVDWQYEPIKGNLIHIDLKRIALDKPIRVSVPVHLTGTAAGVKVQGGILDQVMREVEVECLPGDIPSHIDVDVSELVFGTVLRVDDLPHGGKLKFLTDGGNTVAHIVSVKEEAAPSADALAMAGPTEPEVAKKGKAEAEGETKGEAKK